jgi:hypothetical protein
MKNLEQHEAFLVSAVHGKGGRGGEGEVVLRWEVDRQKSEVVKHVK